MLNAGASPRTIEYEITPRNLDTSKTIVVHLRKRTTKLIGIIIRATDKRKSTSLAHQSKH